jgi:hypothetical protein
MQNENTSKIEAEENEWRKGIEASVNNYSEVRIASYFISETIS